MDTSTEYIFNFRDPLKTYQTSLLNQTSDQPAFNPEEMLYLICVLVCVQEKNFQILFFYVNNLTIVMLIDTSHLRLCVLQKKKTHLQVLKCYKLDKSPGHKCIQQLNPILNNVFIFLFFLNSLYLFKYLLYYSIHHHLGIIIFHFIIN